MTEPLAMPHWAARTRHTQTRLQERYGLYMGFGALVVLTGCIKDLEQGGPKTTSATVLSGERAVVVRCGRQLKHDGNAYLVSWKGSEFAVVYSTATSSLATALPAYTVEQLKNELLAARAMKVK